MRLFAALLAALAALFVTPLAAQTPPGAESPPPEVVRLLENLKPVSGRVAIPEARTTLDLGETYDFYASAEAQTILVDLWGNPPEAVSNVLGLVMLKGASPFSDAWGAVVTFEETGYVSDDDAATTDYDQLLSDLQEGTSAENETRREQGYPEIQLVGWAESPQYSSATHTVIWAQNLSFSNADVNTLNYDVRILGRYGVLSLNLVSSMDKLDEVRGAAQAFAAHASFDDGARYKDFDPATDAKADYGIAGLIAAGAGAAAAKKLGLFGAIGVFIVKFIKPILIGVALFGAGLFQAIKSRFGRSKPEESYEDYASDAEAEDSQSEPVADQGDSAVAKGEAEPAAEAEDPRREGG